MHALRAGFLSAQQSPDAAPKHPGLTIEKED